MRKLLIGISLLFTAIIHSQVHTTYLWHMHQPIYWGETSIADPNRYQMVKESHDLKMSGGNIYSDGLAHPLNDLEEIFSKPDRVNAYQYMPHNAVQSILSNPDAGAQMTYGGSLIENINSLAPYNQWGYSPSWKSQVQTAHGWQTFGGHSRLDVLGFTMHHTLAPLASDEVLRKEIQAHKYYVSQEFGFYSNGFWPAEASFSERIIPVLLEEGFEWTVIANSHLARTLADYPLVFGTNGCNIDPPNKADKVSTTGNNWHSGQIDGRGGQFAAPYCFMPHKAQYIDPETGDENKITLVPMAELDSYRDGFSPQDISNIQNNIAPYADANRPPLVLLTHDGDNAWGGGASYYNEAVPGFTGMAAAAGYVPSTIESYLADYPVPESDVVKVEDGSWFNAANDWGSPQFINWFWPLYEQGNPGVFDPNAWTEDVRNTAVLYAGDNFCKMAEELEGGVDIAEIVSPDGNSSPAEKAWHFLLPGYDSGNAYYGLALDLEIKATLAVNRAIAHAETTIDAHTGVDNTPPSVLTPQRYPYNPGEIGFGPNYGYQQVLNPADFAVWTLAYDVNGIETAVLKYRIDNDGVNPLTDADNDTYAGGSGVGDWVSINMSERIMPVDNVTGNPEVDFFMLPDAIANLYYAYIEGLSNKLVDYYIEITDTYGNVKKTKIHHVWVGPNLNVSPSISFDPVQNSWPDPVEVTVTATDTNDPTPVLYYTTDGTDPDYDSTSAVSSFSLNITETTTIKVFAEDFEGNASDIVTKTYYIGEGNSFNVYFKKPTTWTSTPNIYIWNQVPENTGLPAWPGQSMTALGCGDWYYYTFQNVVSANLIFNGNGEQSPDLFVDGEAWYDWDTGWLTEPPSIDNPCLSISPEGGQFPPGSNVNVSLSATDVNQEDVTIYYTLDGTDPDTSSDSFLNSGNINIDQTTELRAFAQNNSGDATDIVIENYEFTESGITVYFKPDPDATGWNAVTPKVYYWQVVGGSIPTTAWPGEEMYVHQDGWYKYFFPEVTSLNVIFNNGQSGVGVNQTEDITGITEDIWYTWGVGLEFVELTQENYNLYPNPSKGYVLIQSHQNFKDYECYDLAGSLVKKGNIEYNMIDLLDISAGMYYLVLHATKEVYTQKLILK